MENIVLDLALAPAMIEGINPVIPIADHILVHDLALTVHHPVDGVMTDLIQEAQCQTGGGIVEIGYVENTRYCSTRNIL